MVSSVKFLEVLQVLSFKLNKDVFEDTGQENIF